MKASIAGTYGFDLEAVKEKLAAAHGIDFDDLRWPEEPPDLAAGDADDLDVRDSTAANAPPGARDRVDGGTAAKAGRVRRAWDVVQVLLTFDTLLGNPGTTTLREAVGSVTNEVLLFLWLATIAHAPTPPPATTVRAPETLTTPAQVAEECLDDHRLVVSDPPISAAEQEARIDIHEE